MEPQKGGDDVPMQVDEEEDEVPEQAILQKVFDQEVEELKVEEP